MPAFSVSVPLKTVIEANSLTNLESASEMFQAALAWLIYSIQNELRLNESYAKTHDDAVLLTAPEIFRELMGKTEFPLKEES